MKNNDWKSLRRNRKISYLLCLGFIFLLVGIFSFGDLLNLNASMEEEPANALVPNISATLTDSFPDPNTDGKASPGETVTYTAVINNTGTMDATGVMFSDTLDNAATLVPGSVHASPIANDETYNAVGNTLLEVGVTASGFPAVKQTGGVLNNDTPVTDTISVISNTSPTNGSVSLNANGTFTYTPNVNFTGNDSFTYTIKNDAAPTLTDTATVTINVSNLVWFVDNSGANGDGRSNSPFNNLTSANGASGTGDIIFVHRTGTNYNPGITLKNNQQLIGQGVDLMVGGFTLVTATSDPIIAPGNANGINLASGNTIRGLTIGNTGSGIGISGSSVGSLTISDTTVNGTGEGIDINGGSLTVTFDSLSSSNSSDRGIDLNNVSGTFQVTGGTTITSSTNTGVDLTSSGSATFTFADLDITTTNDTGLFANGGTINSTSGTINTGSGRGVDITGATLGLTFTSVSVNGANNGISLTNTTGSFTVTGDGATDATDTTRGRTTAGQSGTVGIESGGVIQNSTAAGVLLNNADNVTLRNMRIQDSTNGVNSGEDGIDWSGNSSGLTLDNVRITGHSGNHGIDGNSVSGLTIIHSEVFSNATASGTEGPDIHNVRFDNLSGTNSVQHSLFNTSRENIFSVFNSSGTANFTMNNSEVRDTTAGADGNVGLLIDLTSSAQVNAIVSNSTFLRNRARGIQYLSNSGTTSGQISVTNNVMGGITFAQIDIAHQSNGTVQYNIANNMINRDTGQAGESTAVNINTGGTSVANTLLEGTISGNLIGDSTIVNSGSFEGAGVFVGARGLGTHTTHAFGNTIRGIRQDTAFVASITENTGGVLNVTFGNAMTMTGNVFNVNPHNNFPLYGMSLESGAISSDSGTMRVNFAQSSTNVSGDSFTAGMQLFAFNGNPRIELQDYMGTDNNVGQIETFLDSKNSNTLPVVGNFAVSIFAGTVTGNVTSPGGVVPLPGFPLWSSSGEGSKTDSPQPTNSELETILLVAKQRWKTFGLNSVENERLKEVKISKADLPSGIIGNTLINDIQVDITAAGNGWFIDSTPDDNSEFARKINGELKANSWDYASNKIDLLTVVTHELGHVIGKTHADAPDLMAETLDKGIRRLPVNNKFGLIYDQNLLLDNLEIYHPIKEVSSVKQNYSEQTDDSVESISTLGSFAKLISFLGSKFIATAHAENEFSKQIENQNLTPMAGETFNVGPFNLPAGKSLTIVFQATVQQFNGQPSMMTQGTVSGGNFTSVPTDDPATGAANDPTVTLLELTPTAADASISGRVLSPTGRGLGRVRLVISGGNLTEPRYTQTNPFGHYRFEELDVGETYIITVSAKSYEFAKPNRAVSLNEDLTGVDFISEP